jgi:MtrB/PioB family decaheme-associated outer membrane protein
MNAFIRNSGLVAAVAALLVGWSASAAADGYIEFGTGGWYQSADEAKYQEFSEQPRGLFLDSFYYRDKFLNGRALLWGSNAIRSDQQFGGTFRAPRWSAEVEYIQVPHNISFVSRTGYTLLSQAVQVLPDSLQRQNQENSGAYVPTMTDFLSTAGGYNLGIRTDDLSAKVRARPGQGLKVELIGSRKNRTGSKPYGGSFGFSNVIETIEPVRQSMADAMGRVSYTKKQVTVEGYGGYSAFENDNNTLFWDNPRRYTDASGNPKSGLLDLYPENQQVRFGGSVGIHFQRRTAFNGSIQWAETKQDDDWLPYTINSAVLQPDTFPLPGTNTDGKAQTLTLDARLTTHPHPKVGGTLRYRSNEYKNKTPGWEFDGQVPYDGSWAAGTYDAHPYGNKQTVAGVDVDVNPAKKVGLYGTYEHIERERTFREVLDDKEDAVEGKVVIRPTPSVQASARVRHGSRESDEFEIEDYQNASGAFVEQPTLRRYDVADRKQDLVDASVSWTGKEGLVLSFTLGYVENDYEQTQLGLRDDLRRTASIDGAWAPTERLDLSGSFGWGYMYSNQFSRRSPSGTVQVADSLSWQARLYDEYVSANGNITFDAIPGKVTLAALYYYERSPGKYRLTGTGPYPNPAQDLPGTLYMRQGVGLEAMYDLKKGTQVGVRWGWEEFNATDFAAEDVPLLFPTTGSSNAIFLGDSILDYVANGVALVMKRTF